MGTMAATNKCHYNIKTMGKIFKAKKETQYSMLEQSRFELIEKNNKRLKFNLQLAVIALVSVTKLSNTLPLTCLDVSSDAVTFPVK